MLFRSNTKSGNGLEKAGGASDCLVSPYDGILKSIVSKDDPPPPEGAPKALRKYADDDMGASCCFCCCCSMTMVCCGVSMIISGK